MPSASLITDSAALEATCAQLALTARLALDTEFLRERTYLAELALIQLADATAVVLIDPLAGFDLAPLRRLLLAPERVKVLHAARQDLEVLGGAFGETPAPIFDTQIAAALIGLPPQIGYADVVARVLERPLAKAHGANLARTDWTRRPLSAAQLDYAADDVRHLLPLASRLEAALEARGRRAWHAEDCQRLAERAVAVPDPDDAWQRLKGIEALPGAEQLRLKALAAWRERTAQARDLPRGWVLTEAALRSLAHDPPADVPALRARRYLSDDAPDQAAEELLSALAAGGEDPAQVAERRMRRPTAAEEAMGRRLTGCLKSVAAELGLAPEVLATQRDLKRIARGESDVPSLAGWRRRVIGEPLLETLAKG